MPQQLPEGAQPAQGRIHLTAAPGEHKLHSSVMNRHVLNIRADVSTLVVWKSGLFFPPHPSSVDTESEQILVIPGFSIATRFCSLHGGLGGELDQLDPRGPFQPQPACDSCKVQNQLSEHTQTPAQSG